MPWLHALKPPGRDEMERFGLFGSRLPFWSMGQLTELMEPDEFLPKIPGIGPGSARVIEEVLERDESPTVERAIDASGRRADLERRRKLRETF